MISKIRQEMVTDKGFGGVSTVTVSLQAIPVYLAIVTTKIPVCPRQRPGGVAYQSVSPGTVAVIQQQGDLFVWK